MFICRKRLRVFVIFCTIKRNTKWFIRVIFRSKWQLVWLFSTFVPSYYYIIIKIITYRLILFSRTFKSNGWISIVNNDLLIIICRWCKFQYYYSNWIIANSRYFSVGLWYKELCPLDNYSWWKTKRDHAMMGRPFLNLFLNNLLPQVL